MPPPSMRLPSTSINYDTYVEETREMMQAARDQETEQTFESEVDKTETGSSFGAGLWGWTKRLPRNIGVGAYRAVLNTVETVDNLFEAGGQMITDATVPTKTDTSRLGRTGTEASRGTPVDQEPVDAVAPLQTMFPGVFESAHEFANEVEANNTISDDITQGVMQFAIPFTGYLKALGGVDKTMKLVSVGRLALAEGATAASAFEAHEGRVADLVEMGRQMDNDFGRVLQQVSPDGSLVNTYVNWMIDRENEGEWEGRFKNAVDSVVTTAGLAGVLKGAASSLRSARRMVEDFDTMTPRDLQRGSIGIRPDVQLELAESVATVSGRGTTIQVKRPDGVRVGHIEAAQRGDDTLQVMDVNLDRELRGRGLSTEIYLDTIQNARARGFKNFVSDTEVSLQAVNSWEALGRRGFKIERNPNVETTTVKRGNEQRQVLQSTDNRPVFSIALDEGSDKILGERQMRSVAPKETQ